MLSIILMLTVPPSGSVWERSHLPKELSFAMTSAGILRSAVPDDACTPAEFIKRHGQPNSAFEELDLKRHWVWKNTKINGLYMIVELCTDGPRKLLRVQVITTKPLRTPMQSGLQEVVKQGHKLLRRPHPPKAPPTQP